jgi:anti-sigma B factor antagonist
MAGLDEYPAAEANIAVSTDAAGVPLITVSGELDVSNADELKDAVTTALARDGERVVFDLGELQFMDSAGIAVLLFASQRASVILREPSQVVRRVVELTGLDQVLAIEP